MNWSSWSEFVDMGGYGPYVWGSLGMMAFVMAVEVRQVGARWRALRDAADATGQRGVNP